MRCHSLLSSLAVSRYGLQIWSRDKDRPRELLENSLIDKANEGKTVCLLKQLHTEETMKSIENQEEVVAMKELEQQMSIVWDSSNVLKYADVESI